MTCKNWIEFVKKYRKAHPKLSYKEALKKASPIWRSKSSCKKKKGKNAPVKPRKKKTKAKPKK